MLMFTNFIVYPPDLLPPQDPSSLVVPLYSRRVLPVCTKLTGFKTGTFVFMADTIKNDTNIRLSIGFNRIYELAICNRYNSKHNKQLSENGHHV